MHVSQDLAVLIHEQESALDWCGTTISWQNSRTGQFGQESVGRPRALNVSSLLQPESVNEGHPDKISQTIVCRSFRVFAHAVGGSTAPHEHDKSRTRHKEFQHFQCFSSFVVSLFFSSSSCFSFSFSWFQFFHVLSFKK